MKTYPVYNLRKKKRKQSNLPLIALVIASLVVVYECGKYEPEPVKEERSDLMRFIDTIEAEERPAKPVVLYQPTSEKDRARVIGEIWGIKGELHETKIFTARK